MHYLRKLFLVDSKIGFIPMLLSLYVIRIIMFNGYFLKLFYGLEVSQTLLFDFGWIKFSSACITYPLLITAICLVLVKIKNISLPTFVILFFAIDFFHNLIVMYLLSGNWNLGISFSNAFGFSFFFLVLGLFGKDKILILLAFAVGYGFGDQFGYWISFFAEYPEFFLEKLPLSGYVQMMQSLGDKILIGLIGGCTYLISQMYFSKIVKAPNNT